MSLTQALTTAVTGMRATQTGLALIASNVANAETPGYVRKTATQVATAAGAVGVGVRVSAINRELDQYVQRQLRVERAGAGYADLRADFYSRLQSIYGVPGSDSTLESAYNKFLESLQTLSTSPESASARSATLNSAKVLTQQLNGMTADVQSLRGDAELALSQAVDKANDAMTHIAAINQQLAGSNSQDSATATLLDQRDSYIDVLSNLMDINVVRGDHNQVSVFTGGGYQLVGLQASQLAFDPQGSMNAAAQWSADPDQRGVGTIVLKGANGGDIDLIASHAIRSGEIAAYIEMRDDVLVRAQTQLDELAANLARALSDRSVAATAVTSGAQSGFDIDLGGLLNGNTVRISYTDNGSGAPRTLTLMRVDDPKALPLPQSATNDPGDQVLGLDFSGGLAAIVGQLNAALGATGLQFSNPAGSTLRILDDGGLNRINVDAVSATQTATSLTGGTPELPFFVDGNAAYTGAVTSAGSQRIGFAGRIAINADLVADPSKLVVFQTSPATPAGDPTRPNFILDRLNSNSLTFSPESGIGSAAAPFTGSVGSFLRQMLSQQGEAADAAANLRDGQSVVFNALQERFNSSAAVNIDEEMANLLSLQNAYSANARVLTTVRDMLDALMKI
jgi:flagellar hook-associated protein 1 FlgK